MPVLPKLRGVCERGGATAWRMERVGACTVAARSLSSLERGRVRPGPREALMRMDSFRIFAGIVFAISLFFLFEAWIKDHQPPAPRSAPPASQPTTIPPSTPPAAVTPPGTAQAPVAPMRAERPHGQRVSVTTDTLKAQIDTAGADLRRVELLKYRDTLNPKNNFVLLDESDE